MQVFKKSSIKEIRHSYPSNAPWRDCKSIEDVLVLVSAGRKCVCWCTPWEYCFKGANGVVVC